MARRKRRNLVYALIPTLVLLAAAEAVLWGIGFEYQPFYPRPRTRWSSGPAMGSDWWGRLRESDLYVSDPDLFWSLRPNATAPGSAADNPEPLTNSMGLRSPEIAASKPEGQVRVVCLGDSCTFGDGVANQETYCSVLAQELQSRRADLDVAVINAGVPGYTSYQALHQLERDLLELEPDLVTLYLGLNDHITPKGCVSDADRAELSQRAGSVRSGFRISKLYQLLSWGVLSLRRGEGCHDPDKGHQVFRVSTPEFKQNVLAIRELGKSNGFGVLLFTIPHEFEYEPSLNPYIRSLAREEKIAMLDLYRKMKLLQEQGQGLYNEDGGHPNPTGHEAIALMLADRIYEMGLLGPVENQSE